MRGIFGAWWMVAAVALIGLAGPWGGVALGQTTVGGAFGSDRTWTLDGSPYTVTLTVQVLDGATLTIEPGVEVIFEQGQGLDTSRGVLVADALGGEPIVFRSADGEVGAWPGIVTGGLVAPVVTPEGEYVSGSIFRNVRIAEADTGVECMFEAAYFEDVTIEQCRAAGIDIGAMRESTLWFKGVTVRDAGVGLATSTTLAMTLVDCVFEDNPFGGAQLFVGSIGTVERCVFRRNGSEVAIFGGGGASLSGNWTVRECLFEENEAPIVRASEGGGGLRLFTLNSTIADCDFISNTSRNAGGGVEVRPSSAIARVRVEGCRFIGNESLTTSGGGMLAGGRSGIPEILVEVIDCHFEANHGDKNGGLAVGAAIGEIIGCTFLDNTARTSAGGLRLYDDVRDLVIQGNEFLGNSTEAAGGGIDMTNTRSAFALEITANVFEGNSADTGGAIGGLGPRGIAIAGNTFLDNSARLGGAVHVRSAASENISLAGDGLRNRFSGNMADVGATIYNDSALAIDATGNCWGTEDLAAIAERIFDASDDPTKGAVAFDPIATACDACPADLDGDGELTIFDFLAFQNLFDLMDPAADFDGDGELTIFDFLAFQNAFDLGCS